MNQSYGGAYGVYGSSVGLVLPSGPLPVYRTPGGALNNPAAQTALIVGGSIAAGILLSGVLLALSGGKRKHRR